MDNPGGEGPDKMGYKYQWTMSPWTSGCIAVAGIVSTVFITSIAVTNTHKKSFAFLVYTQEMLMTISMLPS